LDQLKRRELIALLGAAAVAWPLSSRAQTDRIRRIGLLTPLAENNPEGKARLDALRHGLEALGWREGHNFRLDYYWATDKTKGLRAAAELAESAPDVIVVNSTIMLTALKNATQTVPIVFVQVPDPVKLGLVASLARPGGNITGFTNYEYSLGEKWLDLLREIAPGIAWVAVIQNPNDQSSSQYVHAIRTAARSAHVQLTADDLHDESEIERTVVKIASKPNAGLIVLPGVFTFVHLEKIVSLAAQHRLPAVYPYRYFATAGGVISYGVNTTDLYRRAASYVDRILKGEKPAALPVQAPIKFQLVINLKAANALGFKLPVRVLALADEVIE
jgi:ABC-type uncharacterized transport system substrate-binding protein